MIDNGRAKAMTAHLIHRDDRIKRVLERVMPGAKWDVWSSEHFGASSGIIAKLAIRIKEYLEGLPTETRKVSIHAVKKTMGVDAPEKTFRLARDRALEGLPWIVEGRSLARLF